jgi:hypothetical protein
MQIGDFILTSRSGIADPGIADRGFVGYATRLLGPLLAGCVIADRGFIDMLLGG